MDTTAKETRKAWVVEGMGFSWRVDAVVAESLPRKDGRYTVHSPWHGGKKFVVPSDIYWTEAEAIEKCISLLDGIRRVVQERIDEYAARLVTIDGAS